MFSYIFTQYFCSKKTKIDHFKFCNHRLQITVQYYVRNQNKRSSIHCQQPVVENHLYRFYACIRIETAHGCVLWIACTFLSLNEGWQSNCYVSKCPPVRSPISIDYGIRSNNLIEYYKTVQKREQDDQCLVQSRRVHQS